jgi:DNA-binding HxlR family transcriptional regulator
MLAGMRAAELAEQNCSIARPAALLGDRWTLVILRQAFNGTKRFEDFQSALGISRSLLSERLGRLVEAGVLRREPYKDEVRTRDRYRLTQMGLDLYPVLMALREWGDRYLAEDGPPLEVRHRECGGEPTLELRCSKCGEEVGARDAEAVPGPGVRVAA